MEDDKEPVYASKAKPWLKYYEEKYIHQSVPECSAFALVCRNNERHLGDTALEYYGRKFSYADLIVQVKKTAAALQALGVKKGDIITVVSVMTPEVVYTFYAADLLGATLNLVDPRYSAEGIREYIEEVESRLLICLNVVYPRCHQAAKRTSVERVVVLSPADSLPLAKAVGYKLTEPDKNRYASNVLRWKDFIAAGKGHSPAAVPYDPQHTCVVVHTGGTTGSPKGVMLTDYCFNALAQEFAAQSRLFHRGQKLLNVMPPFIAYGYSCGIHMPLVMGLHIIIIPNLDPEKLGALVWKYKPEHMFGVPTHYQQLAADPLLKNKDLSFIRNYAAGGDSLSLGAEQTVNRFLKAHGVEYPLAKGYGMTEVGCRISVPDRGVSTESVGRVINICDVRTENGEIQIKTPTIMLGYYKMPEETAKMFTEDGWFRTGDIGYVTEDRQLFITGRVKNLIILSSGENVSPEAIEKKFKKLNIVDEVVVYGENDRIVAEIYPDFEHAKQEGIEDIPAEIERRMDEINAGAKTSHFVSELRFRDEPFEKTSSGKIKRKETVVG